MYTTDRRQLEDQYVKYIALHTLSSSGFYPEFHAFREDTQFYRHINDVKQYYPNIGKLMARSKELDEAILDLMWAMGVPEKYRDGDLGKMELDYAQKLGSAIIAYMESAK